MEFFISEKRGFLLLVVPAFLGVLFLLWPDRPDSTTEETTANGYSEEFIEVGSDPFRDIFREKTEVNVYDVGNGRATRVAETAYGMFWEEFFENMDLSDEPTVRAIITEWHRFNLELIFAQREGDITFHELARSVLSVEDLQTRLTPHLTAGQLVDVVANFEAFSDYIVGRYAYRRASAGLQEGRRKGAAEGAARRRSKAPQDTHLPSICFRPAPAGCSIEHPAPFLR